MTRTLTFILQPIKLKNVSNIWLQTEHRIYVQKACLTSVLQGVMRNVYEYFLAIQPKYLALESYRLLQHVCTKDQQYSCTNSSGLSQISARP